MATPKLVKGSLLLERYRIESELGTGGMGSVYLAYDLQGAANVAVKVLRDGLAATDEIYKRFRREARALARLSGEHTVRILDSGFAPNVGPILVMEHLKGVTLAQRLSAGESFPITDCVEIGLGIASALVEIHGAGMVHRDIKPSNVMLVESGDGPAIQVKVLDLGIARSASERTQLTKQGALLGTAHYMSPEQILEASEVDARSDLFNFGLVLYELLAGTRAFPELGPRSLMAILQKTPTPIKEVRGGVSPELAQIVERSLWKDPQKRYESSIALCDALRHVRRTLEAEGGATTVPEPKPAAVEALAERAVANRSSVVAEAPRRSSRLVVFGALICLAGVAALAAGVGYGRRPVATDRTATPTAVPSVPTESSVTDDARRDADVFDAVLSSPPQRTPTRARPSASPGPFRACHTNADCGPSERCYPGGCACPSGTMRCEQECKKPATDPNDCGCGQHCSESESCEIWNDTALCKPCPEGLRRCGNGNGCVNFNYDRAACGGCNRRCAAGQVCRNATCGVAKGVGEPCASVHECVPYAECTARGCQCFGSAHACGRKCQLTPCDASRDR